MDITGFSSRLPAEYRSVPAPARMRNLKDSAALSLLPPPGRSPSGRGLDRGIYDAVAKQSQGLFAGGRAAMNAAYAVLGIDMSQSSSRKAAAAAPGSPSGAAG